MTDYRSSIRGLLDNYGIGSLQYADDQSHGYANHNFKITTTTGNYFARFFIQQSAANVKKEMLLMSALRQNKFKTAFPVQRSDGDFISYIDDIPVVIYEYLEGHLPQLNAVTVSEIAREVARLSIMEIPSGLTKKNAISLEDCMQIIEWDAFRDFKHRDVTDLFYKLFELLKEKLDNSLPAGIVHGDVFPDNTLFADKHLVGLVDFEEFAIDTLLFDIGMTINGFCFEDIIMKPEFIRIFISEYNSIRSLSNEEKEMIVDYMAWGAVGMTSWHFHQLLFRKNNKQLERVRVLLKRAEIIFRNRLVIEKLLK